MDAYVVRPLSDAALAYARDNLWRARGLETALGAHLDEEHWAASTLADPTIPEERLAQLGVGGDVGDGSRLRDAMISIVAEAIRAGREATWVVPHPLAQPRDPALGRAQSSWQAIGDAVYFVVAEPVQGELEAAWREARSAAGSMGLVTRTAVPASPTQEDLRRMAAEAVLLVFEAYDGDGFVLLSRP